MKAQRLKAYNKILHQIRARLLAHRKAQRGIIVTGGGWACVCVYLFFLYKTNSLLVMHSFRKKCLFCCLYTSCEV
jgi:hypothetical protein